MVGIFAKRCCLLSNMTAFETTIYSAGKVDEKEGDKHVCKNPQPCDPHVVASLIVYLAFRSQLEDFCLLFFAWLWFSVMVFYAHSLCQNLCFVYQ